MEVYEEDSGLFQLTTNCVKMLLETKQNQQMITEDITDQIVKMLQAREMNYSYPQQQTAGASIIVSARVILPMTTTPEKLALIPIFRQGLDMISSFDKLPSFQWSNAQPLFHWYLESIPDDAPGATKFLELIQRIFDVLKLSPTVNDEFFSFSSCAIVARVFHVTKSIIIDQHKDLELRKLSLEVLSRVIRQCPPSRAPSISLIISGILGGLAKFLKESGLNSTLIENTVSLFTDATVLVFADDAVKFDLSRIDLKDYRPEMHGILLNQTPEWRNEGAVYICEYIQEILSRYMAQRTFSVRQMVCNMVIRIQKACPELFGEKLYNHLLAMYKILKYDVWPEFQEIAVTCLELVKNRNLAQQYFYDQLELHIRNLPVKTRQHSGTQELNTLCALLNGIGDGIRLMCTTGSETIELLFRSLADSVVINKKRIMITSDSTPETVEHALRKMKIQYDVNHSSIRKICEILANLGGIEVIDIVHNLMRNESSGKRASYHIILGYLLSALNLESTPSDEPIILMLAEYLVEEINKSCVINVMDGTKLTAHRYEIDSDTCVESLSLTNVALCMKFIGQTANRSNISVNCLCTILMQTTSTSWIVSESAEFALKILAQQDKSARSEAHLVEIYSSHILNRVSMACSSRTDYHMSPILLKGFLRYSKVSKQFEVIRVVVEKMLYALDNNEQRYTYCILQALVEFMGALSDEYPNQEPIPPPEDSEDEKPRPTPQHIITEKILLRTKHLITSDCLSIKILTLRLISFGLDLLRCYDDMLLPMIHQNWFGLMSMVKKVNECAVLLPVVIDTIVTMADVSGTFVHNKILKEFWPMVEKYFMKQIARRDDFDHTSDFENVEKMIETIPQIITLAGITEEEANETFLKIYTVSMEIDGQFAAWSQLQKQTIDDYYHRGIPIPITQQT